MHWAPSSCRIHHACAQRQRIARKARKRYSPAPICCMLVNLTPCHSIFCAATIFTEICLRAPKQGGGYAAWLAWTTYGSTPAVVGVLPFKLVVPHRSCHNNALSVETKPSRLQPMGLASDNLASVDSSGIKRQTVRPSRRSLVGCQTVSPP